MFAFLSAAQDFFGSVSDLISNGIDNFYTPRGDYVAYLGDGGGGRNPATLQIPNA